MTPRWVRLWAISAAMLLSVGCSHFAAGPPSVTAPSNTGAALATNAGATASPAGDSAAKKQGRFRLLGKRPASCAAGCAGGKPPAHMTKLANSAFIARRHGRGVHHRRGRRGVPGRQKRPSSRPSTGVFLCRFSQSYWQRGDLDKAIEHPGPGLRAHTGRGPRQRPPDAAGKEDLRHTISKRILEIYSSRHVVVNGSAIS